MSRKTLSKGNELHKLGRLLARGQDKERGGISIVASRGGGGEGWAPQSWSRTDSSSWPEKHSQFEAAVIGTGVRLACSRDRCRGRDPFLLSSCNHASRTRTGSEANSRKSVAINAFVGLFEAALEKFTDIFVANCCIPEIQWRTQDESLSKQECNAIFTN